MRTNEAYYAAMQAQLEVEEETLVSYSAKRPFYESSLILFRDHLLQNRRQRALQLDIEQRLKRLTDMRALRLRAMKDIREAEMRAAAEAAAEIQRVEKVKAAKPTRLKKVAKATKNAIRGIKSIEFCAVIQIRINVTTQLHTGTQDAIRDMRHANEMAMNEEEQKMARQIRERNKDGGARPEAIKAIKFTTGEAELYFSHIKCSRLLDFAYVHRVARDIVLPAAERSPEGERPAVLRQDGALDRQHDLPVDPVHLRQLAVPHPLRALPRRPRQRVPQGPQEGQALHQQHRGVQPADIGQARQAPQPSDQGGCN